MLDDVEDPENYFSRRKPWAMDYDFSLSNLGRLSMKNSYGKYEIKSIFGPVFSAIRGERVIAVNTHNNKMHFTYIYDKDCFDHKRGIKIKENALKTLQEIIK